MEALLPVREFAAWTEHHALPEAGGVRDQPYALWTAITLMESAYLRVKAQHQSQHTAALLALLKD